MATECRQFDQGQATHFVLTRFNVRNFYHKAEPTDEWLRERMTLFQKFSVPCFRDQSVKNFRWIVFFDSETPEWLRREVQIVSDKLFEPVFVSGEFTQEVLSQTVAERCKTPFVITTRVDNDDAIAFDFVERIQQCFSEQDMTFINLVMGAQYANGKTYLRPYTKNPFSSLVENISDRLPLTVLTEHHYRIDEVAPVLNIRTSHPMWLQVIHGGNVLNELVGLRISGRKVAPYFPCALESRDAALGLVAEAVLGTFRIILRLARRPHRLVELFKSMRARKDPSWS